MQSKLQIKRTAVEENLNKYVPLVGEPIYVINPPALRIGDGKTPGGVLVTSQTQTVSSVITANYTCKSNEIVVVDCRTSGFTVTFPSSPNNGDTIKIIDVYSSLSTANAINVVSNSKINNTVGNYTIKDPGSNVSFIFITALDNWVVDVGKNAVSSGGGTSDLPTAPPADGNLYVLKNNTWISLTIQ